MEMGNDGCLSDVAENEIAEVRPSANFITAISEFLDTDPADLLLELGYYNRNDEPELASAS